MKPFLRRLKTPAIVISSFAIGTVSVGLIAGAVPVVRNVVLGDNTVHNYSCANAAPMTITGASPSAASVACGKKPTATTTTTQPTTTTTTHPTTTTTTTQPTTTTTTTQPSGGSGLCTNPSVSSSNPNWTSNMDPGSVENYWVNNDAWSGSHGPQTINICSASSWNAVSNQPNIGGQVMTYPDTEYDVGGRDGGTTKPISAFNSITSTFAEQNPTSGNDGWDAGYDLWTGNWNSETMIWNQWAGAQSFWPTQANGSGGQALTLGGVPYHFFANGDNCNTTNLGGCELMFFRDTQVASGSVDLLAAFNWEVSHGYAHASDVPTQLEYGTEVCYTSGTETFNTTGLTFNLS